jgi:hypothetical protein
MSLNDKIEDVFVEWLDGISPETDSDLVDFESFDHGLMSVFVWRHEDFDPILLMTLENLLQHRVHSRLLVASLRKRPTF